MIVLERRSVRSRAGATRFPQPTTAGNAVADLHALLTAAGEAGPYVLVAHSYGGLIALALCLVPTPTTFRVACSSTLSPKGFKDAETPPAVGDTTKAD